MISSPLTRYVVALITTTLLIAPQLANAQSSAPTAKRQCYLPNGDPAGDTPCDPTAEHSMCCGSPDHCLSNGLCVDTSLTNFGPTTGNMYARGTCTDPTWKSPFCPQMCKDVNEVAAKDPKIDFRSNGVMVYGCNRQGFGQAAAYCCESVRVPLECCTSAFSLVAGSIGPALAVQTFAPPVGTMSTNPNAQSTGTSKTSSTAPTGTDNSSTSSQPTNPSSSGVITGFRTTTETDGVVRTLPLFSSTASSTPPPAEPVSGGLTDGAKMGIGIGVGIGAALVIIGILFLYFYRRSHPPAGSSSDPPSSPTNGSYRGATAVDGSSIHATESVTSGGTYVNGRFIYAGASKPELGGKGVLVVNSEPKELPDGRKSYEEMDGGQGLPSEMSTWENSPAELEAGAQFWGRVPREFERKNLGTKPPKGMGGAGPGMV